MWNAPEGYTTFTGPFAVVLAHGISNMLDDLETALEYDDFEDRGYKAFDRLTDEQKIWTIHKVAYGLLDQDTVVKDLLAYLEATVASIFSQIEQDLIIEIDLSEEEPDEDWFSVRRDVLAAYEEAGGNNPDDLEDDEEPLRFDCNDIDKWKWAIETLETQVFWDMDYDMDGFVDMPSAQSAELKRMYGVLEDYYTAAPDDPRPAEALKLLEETRKLCDRVIAKRK